MKINVKTEFNDEEIRQHVEVENPSGDVVHRTAVEVIQLRDQQVRSALLKLGWTPPDYDGVKVRLSNFEGLESVTFGHFKGHVMMNMEEDAMRQFGVVAEEHDGPDPRWLELDPDNPKTWPQTSRAPSGSEWLAQLEDGTYEMRTWYGPYLGQWKKGWDDVVSYIDPGDL
jgi:hypothetical protein